MLPVVVGVDNDYILRDGKCFHTDNFVFLVNKEKMLSSFSQLTYSVQQYVGEGQCSNLALFLVSHFYHPISGDSIWHEFYVLYLKLLGSQNYTVILNNSQMLKV
ncbi:hypothetical protein XENOCAPTIV_021859 [Xenoophorus captivus]|uniref:Uncharacterized protein n=1 Tax=Xenoophorus captivus TaxID=1517983 RepID=A0ABV0QW83_9TELE